MSLNTPLPVDPVSDVVARWRAGDHFGVLCTGDPLFAENVFRALAPTADRAFGNAESVGAEDLAGLDGERVVALAWDPADIHPALLRRCTAVLNCGHVASRRRHIVRSPADLVAATVHVLDSAGVRDHGVEMAATRLVIGLHAGGCSDPLWVVRAVVADPRRSKTAGDDPNGTSGVTEEEAQAGAELAASDDGSQESPMPVEPDLDTSSAANDDPDTGRDPSGEDEIRHENRAGEQQMPATEQDPSAASSDGKGDSPEPAAETDTAAHEIPSEAGAERGGAGLPVAPQRGAISGLEANGEDPVARQAGGEGQGLGQAYEHTDIRVQRALDAMPSRRMRDATTHMRGSRGARSQSPERGPILRVVPPERVGGRVAVIPTLRRAAWRRALSAEDDAESVTLIRDDLRGAIRRRPGGYHTAIIVDGSSSLGRSGLLRAGAAVDQAVAAIAARRGVVSVIVAAGKRARVVAERSTSLARTRQALVTAQTGGGTPLAHALSCAIDLLAKDELPRRRLLLLTDGRATVGLRGSYLPPAAAVEELAKVLAEATRLIPDVAMLPIGFAESRDKATFIAAGVRISG
ncbi:VWA domain-containing protein [Mycobacterium spongiae]|uniref:VWA domain-containing protein n=1 Tax=Mycobacterium spongiae TaxID=886343 RepID=A0A975JWZ5_9MYCO|nr:VWA domain-containing protein [Mycobacterium spongiae]QUR66649.1 VWA domain-containing protein [Mycobacterium spongiae]